LFDASEKSVVQLDGGAREDHVNTAGIESNKTPIQLGPGGHRSLLSGIAEVAAERMDSMRSSAKLIAAGLLACAASPLLAAEQPGGFTQARGLATVRAADRTDGLELARIDAKDPAAGRNRSAKAQKSELDHIIAFYNSAIKQDPKDDDAYFHRGLANFYAGSVTQALADLGKASKLDPKYPYYPLWIDIIDKRSNQESRLEDAMGQLDMDKWPAPVIHMFLGDATPAAVLEAANDPDPKTKRGQICEANFYSGELALQQGDKGEAARLFRLAAADCPAEFAEGPSAKSELEALNH
jgi:tetratricopeptide (TPR) repeat protein